MVGNGGQLLRRDAERRPRHADGGDRKALRVEYWNGDAAQALFELLIVDGVAAAAGLFDFGAQRFGGVVNLDDVAIIAAIMKKNKLNL